MNSSHFLTRQYLKLLQTMVYISNKGLSTRPVQYLLISNTAERKIISDIINLNGLLIVKN
jgi:hypothetical protein